MIKLVRVDHRLLHGQVIFSWTKQVGTNYIIVADDKVPNDPISMMALSIAKPVDCELSIIPFSQLRKLVDENASKNIMTGRSTSACEGASRGDRNQLWRCGEEGRFEGVR